MAAVAFGNLKGRVFFVFAELVEDVGQERRLEV